MTESEVKPVTDPAFGFAMQVLIAAMLVTGNGELRLSAAMLEQATAKKFRIETDPDGGFTIKIARE